MGGPGKRGEATPDTVAPRDFGEIGNRRRWQAKYFVGSGPQPPKSQIPAFFSYCIRVAGDFWAQPPKIHPFTTSTGCKLVAIHLDWPISYVFFRQVPASFFFIVMTTGQELGHWKVSRFFQCSKIMKCSNEAKVLHVRHLPFTIHHSHVRLSACSPFTSL